MNKIIRPWTPERIELLVQYIRAGLSAREVAEKLNTSRGAVIGKAWRVGRSMGHIRDGGKYRTGRRMPVPEPEQSKPAPPPQVESMIGNCVTPNCRGTRQRNVYGLCAECDKERVSRLPRRNKGWEVTSSRVGNYG